MIVCEVCNTQRELRRGELGPATTLFRVNKPGEMPARWRCKEHLGNIAVDPEVQDIVNIIEADVAKVEAPK